MNSSGAFRWSIAGVLLLTIGWKIAIQPDNPNYLKDDLIKFLERNHFNVVVTDETVNYTPIIRATTASCHLQIARLTPDGSNRDLIRHLSADRSLVHRLSRHGVHPTANIIDSIVLPLVQVSSRAWID